MGGLNSLELAAQQLGVTGGPEKVRKRSTHFQEDALIVLMGKNYAKKQVNLQKQTRGDLMGMSYDIELQKFGLTNTKIHKLNSKRLSNWLNQQQGISRGLRNHILGIIRLKGSNEYINRRSNKIHNEVQKRKGISDAMYAMVMSEHSISAGRAVKAYRQRTHEVFPNQFSLERELLAVRQSKYSSIQRFSNGSNSNISSYTHYLAKSGVRYDSGANGLPGQARKVGKKWEVGRIHDGGGRNVGVIKSLIHLPPIACASFVSLLLYKMGRISKGSRSVSSLMAKIGARKEYVSKDQLTRMKVGDVISTITTGRADDRGYTGRHVGVVASVDSRGRPLTISHMTDSGGARPQITHYDKFMTPYMRIWKTKRFS